MSCEEWTDTISASVDGELPAGEAALVESHLSSCQRCRQWVRDAENLRRRMLIRVPRASGGAYAVVAEHDRVRGRRARLARAAKVACAAAVVVLAGWGLLSLGTAPNSAQVAAGRGGASEQTVEAERDSFDRDDVTVHVGDTVTWVNDSGVAHRLVRNVGSATVEAELEPGASDEVTFEDAGTYQFHCSIHPAMSGTVTVRS